MKCPSCESDYGIHASMRFCPHCGFRLRKPDPEGVKGWKCKCETACYYCFSCDCKGHDEFCLDYKKRGEEPLVETTGADGFVRRPVSNQAEQPCVRCKGDLAGVCETCQGELTRLQDKKRRKRQRHRANVQARRAALKAALTKAASKEEECNGSCMKDSSDIPCEECYRDGKCGSNSHHLTKVDDPTQTCERCGHVGKPDAQDTAFVLIRQLQMNLQKVYSWHDQEREWRESVVQILRCIVKAVNDNKAADGTGVEFDEKELRRRFLL